MGSREARSSGSTQTAAKPSKASLKTQQDQITASYTPAQKILEANLREWRKSEAAKTGKPAFIVFGDSVLHNLVRATPKTISELLTVSGIGPEKADRYGADIIALCRAEASSPSSQPKQPSSRSKPSQPKPASITAASRQDTVASRYPKASALGLSGSRENGALPRGISHPSAETFTRPRPTIPEPTDNLTPEQQALDQRLRDWRKAESEKLNVPLFFVLASATLRSIVLACPKNLTQLKSIHGLGIEKAEKFGPGILEACDA